MKKLIFTDLDGTLLNHHDYCFKDSKKALKKIEKQNIPLIFTTSKTRKEVEKLHKKIDLTEPFIIENGAAVFIPKHYQGLDLDDLQDYKGYKIITLGKKYNQILNFYDKYKDEFGMFGFSDMDIDEISKYTSLNKRDATFAKKRDFTEPFLLKDLSKLKNLKNLASTYNIKITKGGRFYHLIGSGQDKGKAVKKTIELFSKLYNQKIYSYGLGDGENDIPMFQNVNMGIVIKNSKGEYLNCDKKDLKYSNLQGSAGFNEMVLRYVTK